ncbi:hypothetical protein M0M57_11695 [Flavobacterium azooxidireducens]|uniref:Uncharacterized protein n=1 Tax=Flavobacterium azooxidireducens TaxID=1871076 RepID=A0ABY4KD92_9FLAO|nr:hypothetical protein [Flavobacterium azooxidireducens]UPQ78281.1 hypothetical protein M0M57_11695 [Flavobacterium azooxidireducens]
MAAKKSTAKNKIKSITTLTNFRNYVENGKDRNGKKIVQIYCLTNDYIIYRTETNLLCHDEDTSSNNLAAKLGSISTRMTILKTIDGEDQTKNNFDIIDIMSKAWENCFNDKPEIANEILDNLINKILTKSRVYYIFSSLLTFLVVLFVGINTMFYYNYNFNSEFVVLIALIIAGTFGGLISTLIKLKEIYLDPNSKYINIISGASRILILGASACIFYLAYKAEIILTLLHNNTTNEKYYLIFCAFIFGFGERFIPDISNNFNKLLNADKKNK